MSKRKATTNTPEQLAKRAAHSKILDCVRIYLDEHLPDNAVLAEKRMFGMDMFMVRGNMFMGVGVGRTCSLERSVVAPLPCPDLLVLYACACVFVNLVALDSSSVRVSDCWFESAKTLSRRRSQREMLA